MTAKSSRTPINPPLPFPEPSETPAPSHSLYLLTNRRNLIEYLTSGMITPAAWHSPHYNDLGVHCPGFLPLLVSPPSEALTEASVDTRDNNFPVLVELTSPAYAAYISTDTFPHEDISSHPGIPVLLIPGALPIVADGIIVHFRSNDDLTEFRVRRFANLPTGMVQYACTPDLLSAPGPDLEQILPYLSSDVQVKEIDPLVLCSIDGLIGSLALLFYTIEKDPRIPLSLPARLLAVVCASAGNFISLPPAGLPYEYQWAENILAALPTGLLSAEFSYDDPISTQTDLNHRAEYLLFRSAYTSLASTDTDSFVRDTLLDELPAALGEIPEKAEFYRKIFSIMREIFDGKAEFDSFFSRYPAENYPITAGLFTFFQNSTPLEISRLPQSTDIPSPITLSIAALLSGALKGRKLFPVDAYPSKEAVWVLNILNANLLNRAADLPVAPLPTAELHLSSVPDETLSLGERLLLHRSPTRRAFEPQTSDLPAVRKPAGKRSTAAKPAEPKTAEKKTTRSRKTQPASSPSWLLDPSETKHDPVRTLSQSEDQASAPKPIASSAPILASREPAPLSMPSLETPLAPASTSEPVELPADHDTAPVAERTVDSAPAQSPTVSIRTPDNAQANEMAVMDALRRRILISENPDPARPEARASVELCRAAGREDWLISVFPLKDKEFHLTNVRGSTELRISGVAAPQLRLADRSREQFRLWLKALSPSLLADLRTASLTLILNEMNLLKTDENKHR